jgi:hydrogenase maturation protease
MKTLIIGLGNPILGDDGVGWVVAREVEARLPSPPSLLPTPKERGQVGEGRRGEGEIQVDCLAIGGISLMEHMIGYERVILIDALKTGKYPQGAVAILQLDELAGLRHNHSTSAHDAALDTALAMGRKAGADLPDDVNVTVVAIESQQVYDFAQDLTPEIAAAVPQAVERVMGLLGVSPA